MTTALDETLDAAGYAKVICALVPAAAASADAKRETERDLAEKFVIPDESQAASLEAAAMRRASRRRGAARGKAELPPPFRLYPHLNLAVGYADREAVRALRADSRVRRIVEAPEISLIRPVGSTVADIAPGPTWGIARLNVPALWAVGLTGEGVIVGHLDTGVDGGHPALKGAIHSFAEFDLAGDFVTDPRIRDSGDHGTHTAGTIAGRRTGKGSIGVAPGCRLASAMVIEGGEVIDRILGGMDWIVGEGARILSMSLGLRGYTAAFQVVIDALRAADVLPVVAVGNEYANTSRSPGNYANVLSVGASDRRDRVADFSGSQTFARDDDPLVPDLVAPGVGVLSCVPGRAYAEMDGSSMATPHVAGLAALLMQADPSAGAGDIEQAILASCRRARTMPLNRANRGVPDAVAAHAALTGARAPEPVS